MSLAYFYLFIYALLLFTGAYFGKKAGSKISMIMGLVSGFLVLIGLYLNWALLLIIIATVLTFIFSKRLIVTKKLMPSGMLLLASILAIVASTSIR